MSWPVLLIALVLLAIGVEALWLSRARSSLPQREVDKLIFGEPSPQLTQPARTLLERKFIVGNGRSTQVIGVLFVLLGLAFGAVGAGLL